MNKAINILNKHGKPLEHTLNANPGNRQQFKCKTKFIET